MDVHKIVILTTTHKKNLISAKKSGLELQHLYIYCIFTYLLTHSICPGSIAVPVYCHFPASRTASHCWAVCTHWSRPAWILPLCFPHHCRTPATDGWTWRWASSPAWTSPWRLPGREPRCLCRRRSATTARETERQSSVWGSDAETGGATEGSLRACLPWVYPLGPDERFGQRYWCLSQPEPGVNMESIWDLLTNKVNNMERRTIEDGYHVPDFSEWFHAQRDGELGWADFVPGCCRCTRGCCRSSWDSLEKEGSLRCWWPRSHTRLQKHREEGTFYTQLYTGLISKIWYTSRSVCRHSSICSSERTAHIKTSMWQKSYFL